jgi:hypothetical protein
MNVVRIYGGIGNQLFQYAFARAMINNGIHVGFDISWSEDPKRARSTYPRPCRLDKFNIKYEKSPLINKHILKEGCRGFNLSFIQLRDYNFDGYWQYYKYFINILPELKKEITIKDIYKTSEYMKFYDKITSCNSVSVHVRRGDYLTHKGNFRDLPFEYYANAIKLVEGDLFIFSDDLPWCVQRFKKEVFNREITFVGLEDYQDLELMKFCKHNIITNSTFSWWAAMLNDNPDKKVICPVHWLGDTQERNRYPKEWIRIEDYVVH